MVQGSELQARIGGRVRQGRNALGLTIQGLADRAGLSARFLSDVEAGKSNVSINRLDAIAGVLEIPLGTLVQEPRTGTRAAIEALLDSCDEAQLEMVRRAIELALGHTVPRIIALIGIRGAGKSTVGPLLAEALGTPFVELTARIEARATMSVGEVFTLHGEAFYRDLELTALRRLVALAEPCVVALPGGVVHSPEAMDLVGGACTSVWLRASAEDYWNRVFAQGDTRPMAGLRDAEADLRALLARRDPLYAKADLVVDTSGIRPAQVVAELTAEIDRRGLRP